ncbi:DUF2784 domain-containing protein [Marinobacter caseinilyticus]|uniref:DUF2784 domain-containing protein n=1 Tax=Marinobacter caseinilyticus TaxID=2692195 RepID=UPI001407BD3A|nr:DUF2784 domain-containing protein [Marinobacter caseinilyticus]
MKPSTLYQWLADAVLVVHVSLVGFVVLGLVLVVIGNARHWGWVNNVWFRLLHLAVIFVVVAEAWLGVVCPLTTLEMWLRTQADAPVYGGSFVAHWLQELLYYDAPAWVFGVAYTVFALLVVASWRYFPPTSAKR